ncbi:MAG TPA: lysylphosphatidylglycerol synthase transmembrane domain-containing protein [Planctomycetota bacterium]|nr:lysylphosphatidylglycerol synthase transmembrane domain-containing protein [Planctomycetota bacterium]
MNAATTRSAPSRTRRLALGVLKFAVVAALLGFVASRLPWRDRLTWSGSAGEGGVEGEIDGDWTADSVVFRVAPGDLAALPEDLRARVAAGATLERADTLRWQPSLPRVFRQVDPAGLARALGLLVVGVAITATRWWRLLAAVGVRASWYSGLRLTSLGAFFSIVLPGLTGGDLVKAVLVARENPRQRAHAVVSVLVDRLLGIGTLVVMGAAVIVVAGGELNELRLPVLLVLGAGLGGALVYTSSALRRLVRFDALMARLPMAAALKSLDDAVLLYSRRKSVLLAAFALSLANHATVIVAVLQLSRAFGDRRLDALDMTAVVSVSNTVSAIPIAPGGWGVGEMVYGYLYAMLGSSASLGVAVSVSYRLCTMVVGLMGGVFLLLPGARAELQDVDVLHP